MGANFEEAKAQLVSPVSLAFREIELFQQRRDRGVVAVKPRDVAPERLESTCHFSLVGFSFPDLAYRGEMPVGLLAPQRR